MSGPRASTTLFMRGRLAYRMIQGRRGLLTSLSSSATPRTMAVARRHHFDQLVVGQKVRNLTTSYALSSSDPVPADEVEAVTTEDIVKAEAQEKAKNKVSNWRDTRNTKDNIDVVISTMNMNVQRTGRVFLNDLYATKRLLKQYGKCSATNALQIVRCLGEFMPDERPIKRTELALGFWKLFEELDAKLDVSHYNALLKIHLENEHKVSPSEFLSWMEEKGVKPNRVTYQHMIAKYCQDGDVPGATVILEQMKDEAMPINEYVFQSLITGHCRSKDFESARSVLKIMSESGLDVGNEAQMTYIRGLIDGGQSWEEVQAVIENCKKEEVQFDDHDHFQIVISLVKAGKTDEAKQVVSNLPKKSGFFQEMRNFVPQLIFVGQPDLAFDIFCDSHIPGAQTTRSHTEANARDHGIFFLNAMVRTEYEPEKVISFLKALKEKKINEDCIGRLLETCVELDKVEYGKKIAEIARRELGEDSIAGTRTDMFIRIITRKLNSVEEIRKAISGMDELGLFVRATAIAENVMPLLLADKNCTTLDALSSFKDQERKSLSWGNISDAAIIYLLNQENKTAFLEASGLIINSGGLIKPMIWNASLARSYLATRDLKSFTDIVFSARYTRNHNSGENNAFSNNTFTNHNFTMKTLIHLHSLVHRYESEKSADDVLHEVLLALKEVHIGLTDDVAKILTATVMKEETKALISELAEMDKEDYWTAEKIQEFQASRKKGRRQAMARNRDGFVNIVGQSFVPKENIPEDLESLTRLQRVLEKRGRLNILVLNKLIGSYISAGKFDQAFEEIEKVRGEDKFSPTYHHTEDLVEHLLSKDEGDKALTFVNELMADGGRVFSSTISKLCWHFEEKGQEEKVFDILDSLDKEKVVGHRISDLVNLYVSAGKEEKAQKIVNILTEKELLSTIKDLVGFIAHHVDNGDLGKAVDAFEKIVEEQKKLPFKFRLMEKLILAEDMERMQRVLDASIKVIGEEKSLYDLAHNFLDLGKNSQARKLLETPGLRYNEDRVIYIGKNLIQTGNIEGLENFVAFTKNLFACNRDIMYGMLVEACRDRPEKISEIWLQMQEESYPPSGNMKTKMASILEKGGLEVPFEVREIRWEKRSTKDEKDDLNEPEKNDSTTDENNKEPN